MLYCKHLNFYLSTFSSTLNHSTKLSFLFSSHTLPHTHTYKTTHEWYAKVNNPSFPSRTHESTEGFLTLWTVPVTKHTLNKRFSSRRTLGMAFFFLLTLLSLAYSFTVKTLGFGHRSFTLSCIGSLRLPFALNHFPPVNPSICTHLRLTHRHQPLVFPLARESIFTFTPTQPTHRDEIVRSEFGVTFPQTLFHFPPTPAVMEVTPWWWWWWRRRCWCWWEQVENASISTFSVNFLELRAAFWDGCLVWMELDWGRSDCEQANKNDAKQRCCLPRSWKQYELKS